MELWKMFGKFLFSVSSNHCCCWLAMVIDIQLTLLSLLPEWHHLIEFSLYQPISLLLIQPLAAGEGLLYPCEWTVDHHLQTKMIVCLKSEMMWPSSLYWQCVHVCSPHLVAVPPSTDSIVVVSNGDSAEGTEERRDLDVKDVCQVPLKLSSCQKHLDQTHQETDTPGIDFITYCWKRNVFLFAFWAHLKIICGEWAL